MKSTALSDAACASIMKRISRLALGASPASLKWIVPFLYNQLKQRPQLRGMIHRSKCGTEDPYNPELGAEKSRAEESCLWELEALGRHYYAGRSIGIFKERMVRPPYNLCKSLEAESVSDLLRLELGHRWTKKPPTQLVIPSELEDI